MRNQRPKKGAQLQPPTSSSLQPAAAPAVTAAMTRRHPRPPHATAPAIKFYLSDFGNCHIVGDVYHSEAVDVIGTYEYMDLLALESKRCSRATDCYSLGCTLFEMITCSRLYPKCHTCGEDEDHGPQCYVEAARSGPFLVRGSSVLHRSPSCCSTRTPLPG